MTEINFNNDDAIIIFPIVHLVPKREAIELFKEIKALDKKPCDTVSSYELSAQACTGCPCGISQK